MRALPSADVFTRAEARACGWTDSALTRAARAGRVVRLCHGTFARPGVAAAGLVAATRAVGGSVVSDRAALLAHGLPLVGPRSAVPELTVPPAATAHAAAGHLYRATLTDQDVMVIGGVAVTSPARTLVDVARHHPAATSVSALDAALYRGLTSESELLDVLRRCENWPGIRRARRAVSLADGRAESPLESISRLTFPRLRLPVPDLQTVVQDEQGRFCGRLDFYWDELGVAGEADGRDKYGAFDVLVAEKLRQESLEDLRLCVLRWGWHDITRRPSVVRQRFVQAVRRAEALDRAGVPRTWSARPTARPGAEG